MTRYTLTIPLFLNDGDTPSYPSTFANAERLILGLAGGFTRTESVGAWLSENTDEIYREPVAVYTFDILGSAPFVPLKSILEIAKYVKLSLGQEAVYVTQQDIHSHLV